MRTFTRPGTSDLLARAREVLDIEISGLAGIRDRLDESFVRAVETLLASLDAGRKIAVTGIGKCLHVAEKVSATLSSTGSSSVVLHPSQALHGDLGMLAGGDALLALSYSGESEELLALVPAVNRLGVRIVAVTGSAGSRLASCADVVLPIPVPREACPFNMAPTASTTAMMALGDALAMVLLECRGFRLEDYAPLHPAGAIGRALLLRVRDIMRNGDRLASVGDGATVREALLAMTHARSGSAAVTDPDGRVLGIFTDGDLRRRLAGGEDVLGRPVREVMTPRPVSVSADRLAAEALRLFSEHAIDDLLVLDEAGRLVGAVDIQDLPKLKVM